MNDKVINNKHSFVISDQTLERREDIYAFSEFGKIVSRYILSDQLYSKEFWLYLKENFKIKKENITIFCDIHSDVKNRIEKIYKYIIKIDKPYKLVIQFYDEEKAIDDKLYETEEDQKNKITEVIVHFDSPDIDQVDKFVTDIREFVCLPEMSKTFFIISSTSMGYELRAANIKEFDIPLDLNYGESFVEKYNDIVDKLKNNKHGLFLFHGEPGTGKCVDDSTIVTLRNKVTGEIEKISIEDFEKLL
jgi:hypothetical protein